MEINPLVFQFAIEKDDPRTIMAERDSQNAAKETCLFHKHEH